MKRILFVLGLIAGIALCAHRADATTCTVPNTFVNGQVADAGQVNANFSALQGCGNNIDHNNIGSLGIYASQIIPTTVGQAIFGGSLQYQFPSGIQGYAVALNGTGTSITSSSYHKDWVTGTFPAVTGTCGPISGDYCVTVTLTGTSVFTSISTYTCTVPAVQEFASGANYMYIDPSGSDASLVVLKNGTTLYVSNRDPAIASEPFQMWCEGT